MSDPDKFVTELKRKAKNIQEKGGAEVLPADVDTVPKAVRLRILEWCNQVPVLGFNSGRYDLNLPANKIMSLLRVTSISRHYEALVKAYGDEVGKLWFPYEWFDTADKLDHPDIPEYRHWYSKLKGEFVLKPEEW